MNEHHVEATAQQTEHEQMARNDRSMLASENHGNPAVAATAHPGVFKGEGVVGAHGANNFNSNASRPNNAQMDRPPSARTNGSYNANANRPNTNNPNNYHSEDRPQTANHPTNSTNSHPNTNTNQNNANRPNTQQNNGQQHQNNNHPNNNNNNNKNPKPQQHENKPPEHEGHGR
jgi:hypothetical protein